MPFLGLCLGLQCAVIEFARDACGLAGANSSEFDPHSPAPGDRPHGRAARRRRQGRHDAPRRVPREAAARLGRARGLRRGGRLRAPPPPLRGEQQVPGASSKRPGSCARARRPTTGWSSSSSCPTHPFFVGTQAHPEFKSRPDRPHPLFAAFVQGGARAGRGSAARACRCRSTTPAVPAPGVTGERTATSASSGVEHALRRRVPRRSSRLRVAAPDGEEFDRHVVHHPGAVVVVPVDRRRQRGAGAPVARRRRAASCSRSPRASATSTASRPRPPRNRELEEEIGYHARPARPPVRVLQLARLLRRVHPPVPRHRPRGAASGPR